MTGVRIRQLTLAALLIALGVALSTFYIPIGPSKCFPVQHCVNVLAGILLGPLPAALCALCTSLLRLLMGTGTLLAFPGSMIGAFLCGLAYRYARRIWAGCAGELVGTGLLGAVCAYPISALLLGNKTAALLTFVLPFGISSTVGAVMGGALVFALKKTGLLDRLARISPRKEMSA